ncbi:hypothetical protein K438DRAFT_1931399 [Mycena galopus ATCC 62051]|nr:hypothetical protein K438DRAFT_1931399 [Mycena galopus ATCC 62051]
MKHPKSTTASSADSNEKAVDPKDSDSAPLAYESSCADVEAPGAPRRQSPFRTLSQSALHTARRPKHPNLVPFPLHIEAKSVSVSEWIHEPESSSSSSETILATGTAAEIPLTPGLTDDNKNSPTPKSVVFRIKGQDESSIERPPMPVPYETRRSERALSNKQYDLWRNKVANIMCL